LAGDLVHITLFGIHANKARILQVQKALTTYQELIHKNSINGVFDIELKGLGSWTTQSGCVCLYADLSKESATKIKILAKEMSDFVKSVIVDNINIENINLIELKKSQIQTNQKEPVLINKEEPEDENSSTDDDIDIPKNNNREIHLNENNNPKENTQITFSDEESSSNDKDEEVSEEISEEEKEENVKEENVKEGEAGDISGFWIDDPLPEIYIPHITILKTDPKWDKKLRTALNDGKGKSGKREKIGKHGAVKVKEIKTTKEPFGWSFSLYREIRTEYSKTSFGVQRVDRIELQSEFKTITNVFLPNL